LVVTGGCHPMSLGKLIGLGVSRGLYFYRIKKYYSVALANGK
jgi:hypothetical protein